MCKLFDEWTPQIKEYCEQNGLSFEKAKKMSQCWSENDIVLQYYDKESESVKKGLGLLDETPMPAVLWITKENDKIIFKQTEHTMKYLSA